MPRGFTGVFKTAAIGSLALTALLTTGCSRLINGPASAHQVEERPTEVSSWDALYGPNCAACHGPHGEKGPAVALNNPIYLATVSDQTMHDAIANGGPGAQMPAFAQSAGGFLTDAQVNILVKGIRERWAKPSAVAGLTLPPYAAAHPGDVNAGAQVYQQACARCHSGAVGSEKTKQSAGSVIDPAFLSLISDQGLRTIVIAGRPDLGMPDFRTVSTSGPLTDAQITDVVAWMASHRAPVPGATPGAAPATASGAMMMAAPANQQPNGSAKAGAKKTSANRSMPGEQSSGVTGRTQ